MSVNRPVILVIFLVLALSGGAEDLSFRIPRPREGGHEYFPALLEAVFSAAGHRVRLDMIEVGSPAEVRRMLSEGTLDLGWFLVSPEFTRGLVQVPFNLTKGLGGHSLLIIKRNSPLTETLSRIKNLESLKGLGLKAGTLAGSRDAAIWRAAGLDIHTWEGSMAQLLQGLASGDGNFDYAPRSLLAVPADLKNQPQLTVVPDLMLIYPEDYRFFLSARTSRWEPILTDTLIKADRNGSLDALLGRTFENHYRTLDLVGRRKLFLPLPESR